MIKEFIKPELLVMIPVMYLFGTALKKSQISDKHIPWILGTASIILSLLFVVATSLIFIFLPGLIWPKEAIPQVVNIIASFIPATYSVDGIIKVNQMNATFWDIKFNFIWLIALSILYYLLSIKIINKK
jgi:ABC-type multidrug transport system permease subunit